jgi:hypothetical protein
LILYENPHYIIRNGTYFRKINTDIKQISLIQDIQKDTNLLDLQLEVILNSNIVVFNTNYIYNKYINLINRKTSRCIRKFYYIYWRFF